MQRDYAVKSSVWWFFVRVLIAQVLSMLAFDAFQDAMGLHGKALLVMSCNNNEIRC